MKTIQIRCKGTTYLPLDSLKAFQGNLKTLSKPEYQKLWRSFEKHGFRFPVFVWEGHQEVLDGHQRIFVLKDMVKAGWSVGDLPCVEIEASTEKEAKEFVLLISSRYGRVTDEGLYEFIMEGGLDFSELKETVDLPEIDFDKFQAGYMGESSSEGGIVPQKDPNILIRLSIHPGMWLGKREEILSVLEKMKQSYNLDFKVEE